MTQAQFDALIDFINAKVAESRGRVGTMNVIEAHAIAERLCVTEPDE
jgi:hypothetical protein